LKEKSVHDSVDFKKGYLRPKQTIKAAEEEINKKSKNLVSVQNKRRMDSIQKSKMDINTSHKERVKSAAMMSRMTAKKARRELEN
jgi:gas vesicle protein